MIANNEILNLMKEDRSSIQDLLSIEQGKRSDLEQMWFLMDLVWDNIGCDNVNYDWSKINLFYQHPVWILNGLFIEQDETSMGHRQAISNYIIETKRHHPFTKIIDYGGGFGTLAKLIAEKDHNVEVILYEPYQSEAALQRFQRFSNIFVLDCLPHDCDCLISTDVLEHTDKPLQVLGKMIGCVKTGGYLIIANNFNPIIKCHLPMTFHLRYTFDFFTSRMGLIKTGFCHGSHASIYRKTEKANSINWIMISIFEKISRFAFPLRETVYYLGRKVKLIIKHIIH